MPDLSHFDGPFRFGSDGKPVTVDQDSAQDIGTSLYNLVRCPQGFKLNDPGFGIPPTLFQSLPLELDSIMQTLQLQEPRAPLTGTQSIGAVISQIETLITLALFPDPGLFVAPDVFPQGATVDTSIGSSPDAGTVDVNLTASVTTQGVA